MMTIPKGMILRYYWINGRGKILLADGGVIEVLSKNIININNFKGCKYTSIIIDEKIETDYEVKLMNLLMPRLLSQVTHIKLDDDDDEDI